MASAVMFIQAGVSLQKQLEPDGLLAGSHSRLQGGSEARRGADTAVASALGQRLGGLLSEALVSGAPLAGGSSAGDLAGPWGLEALGSQNTPGGSCTKSVL